ncbi:putative barnase/colicin E5 family endoribonuclease, partial [Helicobacter trogontum]
YETRKEAGSLTEDEVKQGAYKGQVAGAFYKEGLGDIDLVWGEVTDPKNHKGYGLAHILDKHPDLDPRLITEIIEKGNLTNQNNIRYRIERDNYVIGLSAEYKGDKRNFIITAFEKNKDKRDTFTEHPFTSTSDNAVKNLDKKENAESLYTSSAITKGETLPLNSKDDSTIKAINESIKRYKEKIKALDDPKLQKERAEKKQKIIDEFNETLHNASPTTKLDKWGTHFSILYIKPEGKKRLQKLKFDTQERIEEAIHHYTNNDRLKMELNVLWNVYNKLKEIDVEYLQEKQRLEKILKGYENDLKNIGVSDLPTTKDLIKQAKESGKSVRETKKLVQKNKELSKKVTSKLSKDELDNLPIATQDELRGFLESVEKKEYQNAPDVLKIATLNDELKSLLNHNNNANVFITKSTAGHISQNRKGQYNQALRMEEKLEIPQIINEAKTAYTGGGDGFVIPFADKINKDKMNLIVLNSDEKGNFLITTKKVNTNDFNEGVYKEARAGVEPATTTLQNAEQKPTEAISLAKPNSTTKDLIKQVKEQGQRVEMKDNAKKLENVFLDSNGKVDLSRIEATVLPKVAFNNTKQFKNLFENKQGKYGIVKTPYKDVKINMGYAYKHFYQNTHNANRDYMKGAFFDVLQKPMFVIEQENDRGLITYFYKVYKHQNGNIGIFGIGVDSGGHIDYRTMYKDDNNQRLNQLLKLDNKKVVYMDNEWLP